MTEPRDPAVPKPLQRRTYQAAELIRKARPAWLQGPFCETVGKRGAAIIAARGLSSAASAANALVDHVRSLVTPGAIQVPGDGRPIVLLADCQTVGGYPKIATVIAADLPRLGHALPGQTLRFVEVGVDEALAARREAAAALAQCIASMVPDRAGFDLDALYSANLIDGVIDAH